MDPGKTTGRDPLAMSRPGISSPSPTPAAGPDESAWTAPLLALFCQIRSDFSTFLVHRERTHHLCLCCESPHLKAAARDMSFSEHPE